MMNNVAAARDGLGVATTLEHLQLIVHGSWLQGNRIARALRCETVCAIRAKSSCTWHEKMQVGMSQTVGFCADLRRCNLARWRLHRQSALAHPKRKNDCLNVLQEMLGGCGSAAASNAGTKGSLYDTLRIKRRSSTSDITLHRNPYQEALPLSRHRLRCFYGADRQDLFHIRKLSVVWRGVQRIAQQCCRISSLKSLDMRARHQSSPVASTGRRASQKSSSNEHSLHCGMCSVWVAQSILDIFGR